MLLGPEMKRKLQLRNRPNEELLRLYDSERVSRLHNAKDLDDTRRMVKRFLDSLKGYPSSLSFPKELRVPVQLRTIPAANTTIIQNAVLNHAFPVREPR